MAGSPLAFLAGVLSILSPCVLPLVPIVFGAAAARNRLGPAALAAGVVVSFVVLGAAIATVGFAIGIGSEVVRSGGAILLVLLGIVLLVPAMRTRLAVAGGPFGSWARERWGDATGGGAWDQFTVGLLLGAVWSPCVGPTLGAASVLAAQGRDLGQVIATMAMFGAGAGASLLLLGLLSRRILARSRSRLHAAEKSLTRAFGTVLVGVGLLVLSGADRAVETALVDASPAWLTTLTTWF